MSITLEDVKTAMAIIDRSEGSEITLRFGDVTLIVRRGGAAVPDAVTPQAATAVRAAARAVPTPAATAAHTGSTGAPSTTAVALTSPLTGVIYRAPSPSEPPFVEIGTVVTLESTACIIDVMKVMNLIKAPVAGTIVRIDVEDGQLMNKGDVILWIEPSA
jgi:acetyl-CoA carboxylase biotin carboxyl carrier protein